MDKKSFSFVVYIIHACANKWGTLPSDVYDKLKSTGCIRDFLVSYYDVLHTQGTDYIVGNVKDYLTTRGVTI